MNWGLVNKQSEQPQNLNMKFNSLYFITDFNTKKSP